MQVLQDEESSYINATSTRERSFRPGCAHESARMLVNVRLETWQNQRLVQ